MAYISCHALGSKQAVSVGMFEKSRSLQARRAGWGDKLCWLLLTGVLILSALQAWATWLHAVQALGHPYALDYGEGPLVAQLNELRGGRGLAQLYSDPGQPPYLVVNYPPLMLLLAQGLSLLPLGDGTLPALLAGRLVTLGASLAAGLALLVLARETTPAGRRPLLLLAPLLFLSLSLVREWSVLMRVDMLALALALWGLALALRAPASSGAAAWAGVLFALSLLSKPSFLAAPAAAALWLLLVAPRRSLLLVAAGALVGGLAGLALQLASDGWFLFHVIKANVNRFDAELALYFWRDHALLHWPLGLAAGAGLLALRRALLLPGASLEQRRRWLLPLLYCAGAALSAMGVGKVGAYSNYFLELDAALVWLACAGLLAARGHAPATRLTQLLRLALLLCLLAQAARYYPLWDATRPRNAARDQRAPRLAIGRFPIWHDLAHEREILEGQQRVQQALNRAIQATGPGPVLTDTPGVVVVAGARSRLQLFEMRQLLDQGLWRQDQLLQELANGEIQLVLLEWLGNWLSPEMVTLIRHRYALDGSLGLMRLYRPVALGPWTAHQLAPPAGPLLEGYHLLPPIDQSYRPGEQLTVSFSWQRGQLERAEEWELELRLEQPDGRLLAGSRTPLLYGILPSASWPDRGSLQQVVRLTLPEAAPGSYRLVLALQRAGAPAGRSELTSVSLGPPLGRYFAETRQFVPAPFLAAWLELGGLESAGFPVTPALPFNWGWLQCFERICLERRAGAEQIVRRPLGELLSLELPQHPSPAVTGGFHNYWQQHGGAERFGPAVTGELRLSWPVVQYFRYARMERPPDQPGPVSLGRLGAEYMQLNDGDHYSLP